MVSSTGKAFKRKYWVNPKDVKPGDKVVKEGAETTKPDAGKQTPVAHVESRAPSVAPVQVSQRELPDSQIKETIGKLNELPYSYHPGEESNLEKGVRDAVKGMNVQDRLAFLEQCLPPVPDDFSERRMTVLARSGKLTRNLVFDGLTPEQRTETVDILSSLPPSSPLREIGSDFLFAKGFTGSDLERLSDNMTNAGTLSRDFFGFGRVARLYSTDHQVAIPELLDSWAVVHSSPGAHLIKEASRRSFGGGQAMWTPPQSDANPIPPYSARVEAHVQKLKQGTEAFYKKKFATKANPDPDLSKIPLELGRGVGGHIDNYAPAGAESWTVDKGTVPRFGKLMRDKQDRYTVLKTTATYDDALFTWESVKGQKGWPEEQYLKGKKEVVLLGARLKDVQATKTMK